MRKITWIHHVKYRFDQLMSRGTIALVGALGLLSAALVGTMALLVSVTGIAPAKEGGAQPSFVETAWSCLMRTLDAGTMGGDTGGWPYLLAMLLVTFGGVFIVSTFIGLLTSGIEARLDELRKGRSLIVENDHVVILGWTPQIFAIISELLIANENKPSGCIAILADKDKVEMDDEIRAKVGSTGRTTVVCRTGSPTDPSDLEIVNPDASRAIVVLSPEVSNPDAQVIKSLLALINAPDRRKEPFHIVAQIREARNSSVAKMVGADEVEVVLGRDLISRIAVQTSRQSGLSIVVTELLDFGGDEIYFQEEPKLIGKTFGEALLSYEDSCIIGLADEAGVVKLNPPMDRVIARGDKVIAVSEDDDTVRVSDRPTPPLQTTAIRTATPRSTAPERTLILGWNAGASTTLRELDNYVPAGSTTVIIAQHDDISEVVTGIARDLENQTVSGRSADTTDRTVLDSLEIKDFDQVMVLSDSDQLDPEEADARTLITLLHLREIVRLSGARFRIVSEMLDVRNRALAEATKADDFIVSDRLVSLLMSQIAENKALARVFADLFDSDGSELTLHPVDDFVTPGVPVNFYTVVESARRQNMIALGYRRKALAQDAAKSYGVVVNPEKSKSIAFEAADRILILAED